MEEGDSVPLASIKNDTIRSSARWLLDHLQKADADAISAADIETQKKIFCGQHAGSECTVTYKRLRR